MDMKTLMQEHGEKVALGGAGIILAVYVVMGWVLWTPSDVYTQTESLKTEANLILAKDKKPELPVLPTEEQVRAQWKVDESLGNAQKGLEWVAYYRTKITAKPGEVIKPDEIALCAPIIEEPTVAIGQVNLAWDNAKGTNAVVKTWVISRKTGSGAWEELTRLAGEEKTFADTKTSPKTTYSYKVKAIPDEVPKVNNLKGDESGEVSITTPDTTSISFVGGSEQMAIIQVLKYINGEWMEQKANVRPGSKIGKAEMRRVGGKMGSVDFSTGYELLGISKEPNTTKVKKTRAVWKKDANGKPYQDTEEYEEVTTVTMLKIKYKDDTGAEKELWQEPPKEKEAPKAPEKPKEGEGK